MARKKSSPTKTTAKKGESKSSDAKKTGASGGDLGFEAQLWKAADAPRPNLDAAVQSWHFLQGPITAMRRPF